MSWILSLSLYVSPVPSLYQFFIFLHIQKKKQESVHKTCSSLPFYLLLLSTNFSVSMLWSALDIVSVVGRIFTHLSGSSFSLMKQTYVLYFCVLDMCVVKRRWRVGWSRNEKMRFKAVQGSIIISWNDFKMRFSFIVDE